MAYSSVSSNHHCALYPCAYLSYNWKFVPSIHFLLFSLIAPYMPGIQKSDLFFYEGFYFFLIPCISEIIQYYLSLSDLFHLS